MKIAEVRDIRTPDLHSELDRLRRHLFDLRAQAVTEKLENPHQMKVAKRDIARVLTVLNERGEEGIEEKQHHLEAVASRKKSKKEPARREAGKRDSTPRESSQREPVKRESAKRER